MIERWLKARPHLLPAIQRLGGTHTEEDVFFAICRGAMQLWLGDASAIVTEIVRYPRKSALNIMVAGGDLTDIKRAEERLTAFAIRNGCARIQAGGRDGWVRVFPRCKRNGTIIYRDMP